MKQPHIKSRRSHSKLMLVFAAISVGGLGSIFIASSFAYTDNNAHGTINYCQLENNVTTIYGWANDPQAPQGPLPNALVKVNSTSSTVATNIAGYRDAAINNSIKSNYPDWPITGTYGFRVQFSGLYKGTHNTIGGTAINYGAGVSSALGVTTSGTIDGQAKPVFPGNVIPDACLAVKPLPPPLPQPTPTPTPAPVKTTPKPPAKSTTPTAASPSNAADGTVTAGTTNVAVKFPAGNATVARLVYGEDGASLSQTTPDVGTNNADTTITLTGLTPKTSYQYQIVRLLNDKTATSAVANFKTTGYTISLQLTSGKKPVSGIAGQLDSAKATSDKNGKLTFKDLEPGSYSIRFTYKDHTYSQTISTDTAVYSESPKTTVVSDTVNLDNLTKTAVVSKNGGSDKHSATPAVISLVIVLLVLVAGAAWFFLRRRSVNSPSFAAPSSAPAGSKVSGDILDVHSHHHLTKKKAPEPEPLPQNAGKSLRELVLESMRAEAAKRKSQQPPHDPPA